MGDGVAEGAGGAADRPREGGSPSVSWIASFEAEECRDPVRVGGKASGLARLVAQGHPVPRGFAVTTDALRHFCAHHGIRADADRSERRRLLLDGSLPLDL